MLKFLGEDPKVASCITSAVAVSVPCDLYDALLQIDRPQNFVYQKRFLKHLKEKLYQKCKDFPDRITKKDVDHFIHALKDIISKQNEYAKHYNINNQGDYEHSTFHFSCKDYFNLSQIVLYSLIQIQSG